MNRGECIRIAGVSGMILMVLCLESDFWIPALILFAGFALMAFAGHAIAGEGFLDNDDLAKIDKRKIARNREQVFNTWVLTGTVKKSKRKPRC